MEAAAYCAAAEANTDWRHRPSYRGAPLRQLLEGPKDNPKFMCAPASGVGLSSASWI